MGIALFNGVGPVESAGHCRFDDTENSTDQTKP